MPLKQTLQDALAAHGVLGFLARYAHEARCDGDTRPWLRPAQAPALRAEADAVWGSAPAILSWWLERRERRRLHGLEFKIYLDEDGAYLADGIRLYRRQPRLTELLAVLAECGQLSGVALYLLEDALDEGAVLLSGGGVIRFQRSRGGTFRVFALEGSHASPLLRDRSQAALRNALRRWDDVDWLRRHIDPRAPWSAWLGV
jgi:hypothetical protein